jgi:hypothetical protein
MNCSEGLHTPEYVLSLPGAHALLLRYRGFDQIGLNSARTQFGWLIALYLN